MAGEVDIDHRLPVLGRHLVEHPVAQDAGGVEDDMQPAEFVAGLLHHVEAVLETRDRAEIRGRLAARRLDLVHDRLGRRPVAALAAAADAGIVDNDARTVRRHHLRNFGADAAPRTGADRNPPIQHSHRNRLPSVFPAAPGPGAIVRANAPAVKTAFGRFRACDENRSGRLSQ